MYELLASAGGAGPDEVIVRLVLLLLAAVSLGILLERLKQSPLIGYLMAGTILGPHGLQLLHDDNVVHGLANIGVALLLFSVGLEFSLARLRQLGRFAIGGGAFQVIFTMLAGAGIAYALGLEGKMAFALGIQVPLSSTVCVARILGDRTEMESIYGRNAMGILLMQDIMVVPLVIFAGTLHGSADPMSIAQGLGKSIVFTSFLIVSFWFLASRVIPKLLIVTAETRNRDISILLAFGVMMASIAMSRYLGVSEALGAFIAGMLLAESPFAAQIRADVSPLRVLFATVFFVSIGMLGDPAFALKNAPEIIALLCTFIALKTTVVWFIARRFGVRHGHAIATGLALANAGEFSFVLGLGALHGNLLSEDTFRLMVTALLLSLFLTPLLVANAMPIGEAFDRLLSRFGWKAIDPAEPNPHIAAKEHHDAKDMVLLIGCGPAGQRLQLRLAEGNIDHIVVELNHRTVEELKQRGVRAQMGDATQLEVLEHLHVHDAQLIVITLPDGAAAEQIVRQIRTLSKDVPILVRSRYHRHVELLRNAGANVVIDEEYEVGGLLTAAVRRMSQLSMPGGVDGSVSGVFNLAEIQAGIRAEKDRREAEAKLH